MINNLPIYLKKLDRDKSNSLLYLEGDYDYSFFYNINDYVLNNENILFKIKEDNESYKNLYIIFTDLNIIILSPGKQSKNKGNILYFGNICDIENFEPINYNKEDEETKEIKVFIKFKDSVNIQFNKALIFKREDFDNVVILFVQRKRLIESTFNLIFPIQNMNFDNKNFLNNILKIIKIRENELLDKDNDFYTINNLTELYQKLIEFYSASKDDKAKEYIIKLQKLIHSS